MQLILRETTNINGIIAANTIRPGYLIAHAGLLYRKWSGQITSQAVHTDSTGRRARMAIIEARADALAALWASASSASSGRADLPTTTAPGTAGEIEPIQARCSMRRISASTCRPVLAIAASACLTRSGSDGNAYEAPSAWITMTLTLLATKS